MADEIGCNTLRAALRQSQVMLCGTGVVGVADDVDEGLVVVALDAGAAVQRRFESAVVGARVDVESGFTAETQLDCVLVVALEGEIFGAQLVFQRPAQLLMLPVHIVADGAAGKGANRSADVATVLSLNLVSYDRAADGSGDGAHFGAPVGIIFGHATAGQCRCERHAGNEFCLHAVFSIPCCVVS